MFALQIQFQEVALCISMFPSDSFHWNSFTDNTCWYVVYKESS